MIPTPSEVSKLRNSDNKNAAKKVQEYCKLIEPILSKQFTEHAALGKLGTTKGTIMFSETLLDYVVKSRSERNLMHQAISQVIQQAGWQLLSSFYPEVTGQSISLEVVNPKATK